VLGPAKKRPATYLGVMCKKRKMKILISIILFIGFIPIASHSSDTIEVGNFTIQTPTSDWEIFSSSKNHVYMHKTNNLALVVSISALESNTFKNMNGDFPSIFTPLAIQNNSIEIESGKYSTKEYNNMKCLNFYEVYKADKDIKRKQEGYFCSHSNNKDSIAFKYLSIIRGKETDEDISDFSNAWNVLNNINIREKKSHITRRSNGTNNP